MVPTALDAAMVLAEEGIDAGVMDLHTIRPMDEKAILKAAQETGAILVAEEHLLHGGVGSNVARIVAENHPIPMRFVGLEDTYVDSADPADLLRKYHLTAGDLVSQARDLILAKQARDV
jgi:transketolase